MNQLEVSSQDTAALRTKCEDVLNENQRLEQNIHTLRSELSEFHRQQEVSCTNCILFLVSQFTLAKHCLHEISTKEV